MKEHATKTCFKCGRAKVLAEFYKHKQMKDGRLNKCKCCTKNDVRKHREQNIERIREYDRARGNRQSRAYHEDYRKRFPAKYRASTLVGNSIRDGRLVRENCEVCGAVKTHAHHDDYAKPLDVRWLCPVHHRQWHMKNGPGRNGCLNEHTTGK